MKETDRRKTLDQLEKIEWTSPDFDSSLVKRIHGLRKKPLSKFDAEDLRICIGQKVGMAYLIPIAIEKLKINPFVSGDLYEGDLLLSTIKIGEDFWNQNLDLRNEMTKVLGKARNLVRRDDLRDEIEEIFETDWKKWLRD